MDYLDLQIFRSLGFLPYGQHSCDLSRLNPWVIAKKVGADGRTVKLRLNKMQKNGFIHYFQIYPNFRLLGLNGVAYVFDVGDVLRKYEVIDSCALVDGVTEIHNFIGPELCIDFTYQDSKDESRRLQLFEKLTHCDSPIRFYERAMPKCEIALSNVDWKIVRALRYNAFKPLSKVAEELGLTAKTVHRRFERMAQNNAIIIVPVINPAHIAHTITYVLLLYPNPDRWSEVMDKVMKTFNYSYFLTRMFPPWNGAVYMSARTLAETEDNLITVRKIEGMNDAKILILKEIRENTQWMDSAMDRKITDTTKAEIQAYVH